MHFLNQLVKIIFDKLKSIFKTFIKVLKMR